MRKILRTTKSYQYVVSAIHDYVDGNFSATNFMTYAIYRLGIDCMRQRSTQRKINRTIRYMRWQRRNFKPCPK